MKYYFKHVYITSCLIIINANLLLGNTCSSETNTCKKKSKHEDNFDYIDFFNEKNSTNNNKSNIELEGESNLNNLNNLQKTYNISHIVYKELFKKEGDEQERFINSFKKDSNYTDYYDFSLSDIEINSLIKSRSSIYPQQKFKHINQGNFLHFYKIAYEKNMPVFFTTSSYSEGFIRTIKKLKKLFYEEVLIHLIRRLADNMISYISVNKDKPKYRSVRFSLDSIQVYYSLLSYLASNKIEEFVPKKDIESEFNRWKKIVDACNISDIFFLGKKKKINYSFLNPKGYWKNSQRLINIWKSLGFLVVHKFNIDEDIRGIWLMGRLVEDANLGEAYNTLSSAMTYFNGQNYIIKNIVDIYRMGKKEGIEEYSLSSEDSKKLIDIIKSNKNKPKPNILDHLLLYTKEEAEFIKYSRESHSHFINEDYKIIDWIINKVTDYRKENKRTIVSILEIIQAITGNKVKDILLKNRMKGIKRTINDSIMKLRDFVDFSKLINATEKSISYSIETEQENWKENLLNYLFLLSKKANYNANFSKIYVFSNNTDTIQYNYELNKNYSDPLYYSHYIKENNFNMAVNQLINYESDYKVFSRYMKYKIPQSDILYDEEGNNKLGFKDVWVEDALDYYNEVVEFINRFESKTHSLLTDIEKVLRVNFKFIRNTFKNTINDIKYSSKLLIDAITMQREKRMTEEMKNELKQLLYVEEISETWEGWFARLYDIGNQLSLFNYDCNASFIHSSKEDEEAGYLGSEQFIYNKFNNIGVLIVKDNQENKEKLMLFSGAYYGEIYQKKYVDNLDIIKDIVNQRLGI